MKKVVLLGIAVSAILVASACSSPEVVTVSLGSCEAPSISVSTPEVQVGDTIEVSGTAFFDGCADAIAVDESGQERKDQVRPLSDIPVMLEQDGTTFDLGAVSANHDGSWSLELPFPTNLTEGLASISAGTAEPVEITIDPAK